ncbi:heme-binding protein [Rhizobium deserti]|uniref:Heme-binding protein n=1 Tax=Rhizobium deserti TaxID=2547961 RepID=A0A4R5U9B6_9HYPH|nr:heme-binding protein [Rhizobium deserti]TDK31193.1 heme-binding protein [Rhizobium deserti]
MKTYAGNLSSTAQVKPQRSRAVLLGALGLIVVWAAQAQAQSAVDLDAATARKVISAAEVEAQKGPPSSIFVVDNSGAVVAAERMDGAFPASARIAQGKAETAAAFWQSTGSLENMANGGRVALLSSGYVVMQGGVPLKMDGRVVGAIGVSGGNKDQDEAVAKAGAAAFAK